MALVNNSRGALSARSRGIAVLGVIAGTLMLLAGPLTRVGLLPWQAGLALFALGGLAAGIAAAGSLIAALRGARGRLLLAGGVIGALGFAALATVVVNGRGYPAIHDVTTDTVTPPQFVAVTPALRGAGGNPLDYPPENAAAQASAYPQIAPLMLEAAPADVFRKAVAAVQARGWQIVAAVPSEGRIEATEAAAWWGFKDDIVLRIVAQGSGTRVDVRSVSRVGRSDFGANAKRIEALAAALR